MPLQRTGAATYAEIITKACRLSHNKGFRAALTALLGDDFGDIWAAWEVFCTLWEAFLSKDDWPFQTDYTAPDGPGDIS